MKREEDRLAKTLNELEKGIDSVLEKGSENDEVLEIMKELLSVTKVKNKMKYYL